MGDGKKLQEILKERNCSVAKLAADADISVNTLYALIKRDSNISSSTLNKIATALEMPVDELSTLLSQQGEIKEPQEEQYLLNPDTVFEDVQDIVQKLNSLSLQYRERVERVRDARERIAAITKQQEVLSIEKDKLTAYLQVAENDVKNMSAELDLVRKKLQ